MDLRQHRLREIRQQQGLTQEQLALRLGLHRSTISRYESAQFDIPLSVLRACAAVLGVPASSLVDNQQGECCKR